jgi:hypothetical protein
LKPALTKRSFLMATGSAGAILFATGVAGALPDVWGWGLFLVTMLLLVAGLIAAGFLFCSRLFDTAALKSTCAWLLLMGAAGYILAVSALGGYYTHEALAGRLAWKWIVFGPFALAAIVLLDTGIYKVIVERNMPTYRRFGHLVARRDSDPEAMRRTLVDDVVLHRTLFSVSGFRWLKHTLIFWGFALMVVVEGVAVVVRDGMPAFGRPDLWAFDHPLRLAIDFSFDAFGLMSMTGCVMALVWRVMVNGTEEQKYTDTPTALFLFLVLFSGFLVEALRIQSLPPDPVLALSFVGYAMAAVLDPAAKVLAGFYDPLWLIHVIGSCLFIAYVPAKRLIHSCATPMGRMMHSQKGLLEAKRNSVISGLMRNQP